VRSATARWVVILGCGWFEAFAFYRRAVPPAHFAAPTSFTHQATLGGGLLLGWGGLNLLSALAGPGDQQEQQGGGGGSYARSSGPTEEEEAERAAREAAEASARELRLFDEQLRRRERQKEY
jgi:hypothetical protein